MLSHTVSIGLEFISVTRDRYHFCGNCGQQAYCATITLDAGMQSSKQKSPDSSKSSSPGLGMMLSLLGMAILIAALIAYRMIYPFFHQHPR